MVLNCIDTVEVTLIGWHNTGAGAGPGHDIGAGLSENLKSCLGSIYKYWRTLIDILVY